MRREPLYREPAALAETPAEHNPEAAWFPWATVVPLGVMALAGLLRSAFALRNGGRWGGEPSLALLVAGVAALLLVSDLRAWGRLRARLPRPGARGDL